MHSTIKSNDLYGLFHLRDRQKHYKETAPMWIGFYLERQRIRNMVGCCDGTSKRYRLICCYILILTAITEAIEAFDSDGRIVGGEETTIEEVPYIVNLRRWGIFICGGTIITQRCILTAAHCTANTPSDVLTIHAGATKLSESGVVRSVQKTFVARNYNPNNMDMDVAILQLNDTLIGRNMRPLALCTEQAGANDFFQISGWGYTDNVNQEVSNRLRTVQVPVISQRECRKHYENNSIITNSMICASVPGEKDSCNGDSGGPAVYRNKLCGIVSWGIGCAEKQYPGVYTNVLSLGVRTFIKKIVKQNCL